MALLLASPRDAPVAQLYNFAFPLVAIRHTIQNIQVPSAQPPDPFLELRLVRPAKLREVSGVD